MLTPKINPSISKVKLFSKSSILLLREINVGNPNDETKSTIIKKNLVFSYPIQYWTGI